MQNVKIARPDSIIKQPLTGPEPLAWNNKVFEPQNPPPRSLPEFLKPVSEALNKHNPHTEEHQDSLFGEYDEIDYGQTFSGKEAQAAAIFELKRLKNSSPKYAYLQYDHLLRSDRFDYKLMRDAESCSLFVRDKLTDEQHYWPSIPSRRRFERKISLYDSDRPAFLRTRKQFRQSFNETLHFLYYYGFDTIHSRIHSGKHTHRKLSQNDLDRFFFGPTSKRSDTHYPWKRKGGELRLPRYALSNTILCYSSHSQNLLNVLVTLNAMPGHIWYNSKDKLYFMSITFDRAIPDSFMSVFFKICPQVTWHTSNSYFPLPFDAGHQAVYLDKTNVNIYESLYPVIETRFHIHPNNDGTSREDNLFLSQRPMYAKSNLKYLTDGEERYIQMILGEIVQITKFRSRKTEFHRNMNRRNIALEMIGYAKYQKHRGRVTNPRIKMSERKKALYCKGYQFSQRWLDHITEKYQMKLDTRRDLDFVLGLFFQPYVHPDGTRYNPFAGSCRQWTGDISEKALRKMWIRLRQKRIRLEKSKGKNFLSSLNRNYKSTDILRVLGEKIYFPLSQYQYLSRGSIRKRRAELVRKLDEMDGIVQKVPEMIDRERSDPH